MKSEIEIPIQIEELMLAHYLDLNRQIVYHDNDKSVAALIENKIKDLESLEKSFLKEYRKGYPLLDAKGELNHEKLKFWIARQAKFSKNAVKVEGLTLTFHKLKKVTAFERLGSVAKVEYLAEFRGTRESEQENNVDLTKSPIKVGEKFILPKNVISIYYQNMGGEFLDFERLGIDILGGNNLAAYLGNLKGVPTTSLIRKTKKEFVKTNPCYNTSGKLVSPYNYFYHFNPKLEGCVDEKTTSIEVVEVKALDVGTTYPEFHHLFGEQDRRMKLHIFLGKVGERGPQRGKVANR